MEVPLAEPLIGDEEVDAVEDVLRSGWLTHGPKNEEFEDRFAEYVGVDHAITVNSCTSALHLAVEANDITGEVLVPSFTWAASANAVVTAGATPVFVDIEAETRNTDPESVADSITDDTEAIMVVHYGGHTVDLDPIQDIADDNDLVLIEDSAETIGGEYDGEKTGSFGIGCFSLFPTKNMTTGEGGILTTNDDDLAERVRALVGHGITDTTLDREGADRGWYRAATYAGYNFRMSNFQAALGLKQMDRLESMNDRRREHAQQYTEALESVPGIQPPVERDYAKHVYQMYTVLTGSEIDRDEFVERLNQHDVGASVHFYPPVHRQPRYEDDTYHRDSLPTTDEVADAVVTLPMFPQMTTEQREYVVSTIEDVAETCRGA